MSRPIISLFTTLQVFLYHRLETLKTQFNHLQEDFHNVAILNIFLMVFDESFHVSFTFLVLLFWTFLVRFSGPPTPSCQKEQENHKIGPEMSRIGSRKVKETQKIVFQSRFLEIRPKNFLTRCACQKTILAYISRKLDQKYTISGTHK